MDINNFYTSNSCDVNKGTEGVIERTRYQYFENRKQIEIKGKKVCIGRYDKLSNRGFYTS